MRRFRLWLIPPICMLLAGCGGNSSYPSNGEGGEPLYRDKITIGAETWPGYIALFVAQDKEFFRDEGLDVDIKRYNRLGELSKDYVAGKMQGRANLTLDAVHEYLQNFEHYVVLAIDYSNGADAIAARAGIETVKDFEGKKCAYEEGTLEEFFLSWALAEVDLTLEDVEHVEGDPAKTTQLLESGEADVAVTHEPFLSDLIKSGKGHVVYSSKDAPGLITDVLTFRAAFVEEHPVTIQAIVRVYFRALEFCKEHPNETNAILAEEFETTKEDIAKQLEGVKLLDLRDNRTAFSYASGVESLFGNMREIGSFVKKHQGKQLELTATDKLIDSRFIRKLAREH